MITAADLGTFAGALIATFLISRLCLWLLRGWDGGADKVLAAHVSSFVLTVLVAGIGMANGGPFDPMGAAVVYALPQVIWLIVDQARYSSRDASLPTPAGESAATSNEAQQQTAARPLSVERRIEALERLSALHASGALSAEEFDREKRRVLDS